MGNTTNTTSSPTGNAALKYNNTSDNLAWLQALGNASSPALATASSPASTSTITPPVSEAVYIPPPALTLSLEETFFGGRTELSEFDFGSNNSSGVPFTPDFYLKKGNLFFGAVKFGENYEFVGSNGDQFWIVDIPSSYFSFDQDTGHLKAVHGLGQINGISQPSNANFYLELEGDGNILSFEVRANYNDETNQLWTLDSNSIPEDDKVQDMLALFAGIGAGSSPKSSGELDTLTYGETITENQYMLFGEGVYAALKEINGTYYMVTYIQETGATEIYDLSSTEFSDYLFLNTADSNNVTLAVEDPSHYLELNENGLEIIEVLNPPLVPTDTFEDAFFGDREIIEDFNFGDVMTQSTYGTLDFYNKFTPDFSFKQGDLTLGAVKFEEIYELVVTDGDQFWKISIPDDIQKTQGLMWDENFGQLWLADGATNGINTAYNYQYGKNQSGKTVKFDYVQLELGNDNNGDMALRFTQRQNNGSMEGLLWDTKLDTISESEKLQYVRRSLTGDGVGSTPKEPNPDTLNYGEIFAENQFLQYGDGIYGTVRKYKNENSNSKDDYDYYFVTYSETTGQSKFFNIDELNELLDIFSISNVDPQNATVSINSPDYYLQLDENADLIIKPTPIETTTTLEDAFFGGRTIYENEFDLGPNNSLGNSFTPDSVLKQGDFLFGAVKFGEIYKTIKLNTLTNKFWVVDIPIAQNTNGLIFDAINGHLEAPHGSSHINGITDPNDASFYLELENSGNILSFEARTSSGETSILWREDPNLITEEDKLQDMQDLFINDEAISTSLKSGDPDILRDDEVLTELNYMQLGQEVFLNVITIMGDAKIATFNKLTAEAKIYDIDEFDHVHHDASYDTLYLDVSHYLQLDENANLVIGST
ncbi:MAG: hypothetical protein AAF228_03060 [Pseudomonadota bacterium]